MELLASDATGLAETLAPAPGRVPLSPKSSTSNAQPRNPQRAGGEVSNFTNPGVGFLDSLSGPFWRGFSPRFLACYPEHAGDFLHSSLGDSAVEKSVTYLPSS